MLERFPRNVIHKLQTHNIELKSKSLLMTIIFVLVIPSSCSGLDSNILQAHAHVIILLQNKIAWMKVYDAVFASLRKHSRCKVIHDLHCNRKEING